MTFEGANLDILSGLSSLFMVWWYRRGIQPKYLLLWNILCVGLLLNVVIRAILSIPTPFQQFAFDQPNVAVLHFPFVWLPGFIVPLVLFSHLVMIRNGLKLLSQRPMTSAK